MDYSHFVDLETNQEDHN